MKTGKIITARTFNGLLNGDIKYTHTKFLYNGKHQRDYFTQEYHPFAGESASEINKSISYLRKDLNRNELKNARKSPKGSYLTIKLGSVLDFTKKEYEKLIETKLQQLRSMVGKDVIKTITKG